MQFVALKDKAEITLFGALSETIALLDAFSLLVLPPHPFLGFFQSVSLINCLHTNLPLRVCF